VSNKKFIIKIFSTNNSPNGAADYIATFNEFIANKTLKDALIDVADYSHMHNGPGVLLTAHETNWSYDEQYGKPGIMVVNKVHSTYEGESGIKELLESITFACKTLEQTPRHKGLTFNYNTIEFLINDRLCKGQALTETIDEAKTAFEKFSTTMYNDSSIKFEDFTDPANRSGIKVKISGELKA
jgi:hypothetical protein